MLDNTGADDADQGGVADVKASDRDDDDDDGDADADADADASLELFEEERCPSSAGSRSSISNPWSCESWIADDIMMWQ